MAPIGTIQLAGSANAGPAEVELNTLAERYVIRPNDFRTRGIYSASQNNTISGLAAFTLTNAIVFSFRWPEFGALALIKKISFGVISTGTTIAAKQHTIEAVKCSNFLIQDTATSTTSATPGQTATSTQASSSPMGQTLVPSPLRSTMAPSLADIIAAGPPGSVPAASFAFLLPASVVAVMENASAAVGAVAFAPPSITRVADAQPFAQLTFGQAAVVGGQPLTTMFDIRTGEHPLILGGMDGFELWWSTSAATNSSETLNVSFNVQWEELELGY